MADFKPRGAPVPAPYEDPYAGWDLIHRNAMTPAGVYQKGDETAYGWAVPGMISEPANALYRLLDTPSGTMPDPQDPQNQKDALTGLMALYGGNALKGMAGARGAARVAATLGDMEAPRAVSYGNMIDDALSNPNMLRMMDDINYADLNRRALDEYGVGYEGLNSSQEAALRGWSDPALLDLFSDTGKPNPVGAAVASGADNVGFDVWHGSPHDFDKFDMSKIGTGEGAQAYGHGLYFADSKGVAKSYADVMEGRNLDRNAIKSFAPDLPLNDESAAFIYRAAADPQGKTPQEWAKSAQWRFPELRGVSIDDLASAVSRAQEQYKGYLYQTRINADPNHFLDWDKPLSQQSDNVRNAVEAAAPGLADEYARMRATGHAAFQNPEIPISQYAVQPGMSEKLRDAGIPGIKYLDQGSRGAGEGTSNYVLFNDALANIVHKWRGDQQLYSDTGRPNPLGASLVPGAERQPDHLPGPDPDLWPYIY